MIFQQPISSLNPSYRVGFQIAEVYEVHEGTKRAVAGSGPGRCWPGSGSPTPDRRSRAYPHEISGGQAQRVMIAMALAGNPDLLIADEPTTALDVTIQAQILDLMRDLQAEVGMAIVLITHDLGIVAELCDRVAVMYAGQIVEETDTRTLFREPLHPYTAGADRVGAGDRPAAGPAGGDPRPGAQPDRPAGGLPLRPPLPGPQGARPDPLHRGVAGAGGGGAGPPRALLPAQRRGRGAERGRGELGRRR